MCYKKVSYSIITKSPTEIITPFINNKNDEWYSKYGGFHTGIDIQATEIYSYQSGIVTHIGMDYNNMYVVTIQYDSNLSLRYANLSGIYVKSGESMHRGQFIGIAKGFVHFEYLSRNKGDSIWPVHIGTLTHFKQNPEFILDDKITI